MVLCARQTDGFDLNHRNRFPFGYSCQVEWECVLSKIMAGEYQDEFGVEIKQETN
jgi:hypothetical protein